MSEHTQPKLQHGPLFILQWLMVTALPIAVTVSTVRDSPLIPMPPDPTPLGYTWSLLIFAIPDFVLSILLLHLAAKHKRWRAFLAFLAAAATVLVVGCLLDLGFAYYFFYFPNTDAVIRYYVRALSYFPVRWHYDYIPIEEFAFYLLGGVYMLGLYVFWNEFVSPKTDRPFREASLLQLGKPSWGALLIGLVLIGVAYLFKNSQLAPEECRGGWPGYFVFQVLVAVVPSTFLYRAVHARINWIAFYMMLTSLLLVSVIWEAIMGVPYGWWRYKNDMMMGVLISPWGGMPIEAVFLWIVGSWATVTTYETFSLSIGPDLKSGG